MRTPTLTLTTDFGLSDHYAGVMKGVMLRICPRARIVDITHGITPYEIPEAAYTIAQTYAYFPKRSVHVVVVDPGVGSARRPLLVEAAGQYFIGPDNGVFTMIYSREEHKVREMLNQKLFLHPVSQTFHGRDIFAPVAAHLADGVAPARIGKRVSDYLRLNFEQPVRTGKRTWIGQVLKLDRFGNFVTNLHRDYFPDLEQKNCELVIGPHHIGVLAKNYSQTGAGEPFLIFGSGGYLEVSVREASAASVIGCAVGAPAELVIW